MFRSKRGIKIEKSSWKRNEKEDEEEGRGEERTGCVA